MFAFSIMGSKASSMFMALRVNLSQACLSFRRLMFPEQLLKTLHCRPKLGNPRGLWGLMDRLSRIEWFDQMKVAKSRVLIVGGGGLGSNALLVLVRMAFTSIACCDPDSVEDSNRNRQFFRREDVGKPKAHAVMKNVQPYAIANCELSGFFGTFQEFRLSGGCGQYDIVFCGVDNDEANLDVAKYGVEKGIPIVFVNVSRDGEAFRIFIQRPDEACFSCYRPARAVRRETNGGRELACTPDPAIGDCLMAAVSFACRALVLEVCGQRISKSWNCRDITFYGLDIKENVERISDCPVCSMR